MNIKIKDVARLAGVSISTVSNTLSGRRGVSPDKRAAVMDAVNQLGYVPNINASLLKSRKTGNIGLFLPYIDGPFYPALMQEIYHACTEHDYALVAHVARESSSRRTAANILSCNIDAAIVLNDRLKNEDIPMLTDRGLPLVFMDRPACGQGVGCVMLDNRHGVEQEVAYLNHTGHKRVAYLRGLNNHDGRAREEAFRQAMAKAGLPVDENLVMDGLFSRRLAYNCVYQMLLMGQGGPPDAVLCANDEMALGCIQALRDLNYAVPKDVSVLGFDDIGVDACDPPLTTVGYDLHQFAGLAVGEAVRLIGDPKAEGQMQIVNTELTLRKSVLFRFGEGEGA